MVTQPHLPEELRLYCTKNTSSEFMNVDRPTDRYPSVRLVNVCFPFSHGETSN